MIKMKYHKVTDKQREHLKGILLLSIEDRRAVHLKCWCKWVKVVDDEDGYHFLCLKCGYRISRFAKRERL